MKDPKSTEEWLKQRRKASGGWRLLPREVLFSEAFISLSSPGKLILLLAWDDVEYEKPEKKGRNRGVKAAPKPTGKPIHLPANKCKIFVKGTKTITRARKELVEVGFLDVLRTGTCFEAAQFRL
ncbi:MAG: hypothetical protein FJY85_03685, partial [Deltaproteobacteria bacterium]|nr:hypothetical protein [Deltaproteobacteria bacterium]